MASVLSTQATTSHIATDNPSTLTPSIDAQSSQSTESGSSSLSSNSLDGIMENVFGPDADNLVPTETSPQTYKFVMDNIDKTMKPIDMRVDNQTRSLHYVHKYAVRDRLNLSKFDDKPCHPDHTRVRVGSLMPSSEDDSAIYENMAMLVARVLVENLEFLKTFKKSLGRHIPNQYSEEMSQKSTVVG